MGGIAGGVWFDPQAAIAPETLDQMLEGLKHRGPDHRGTFLTELAVDAGGLIPGAALGAGRLSIIDLPRGHQPMSNEDGSVWLVLDGEIYNHRDLRKRLDGTGHHFQTDCDTESIVHLYEDLGTQCFEHLNGMFALALWDRNRRQLILARDRLGKKPLFYQHVDQHVIFASELKGLAQSPSFRKELSSGAIDQFLTYGYVPHPGSIYANARKVSPGDCVIFRQRHQTETCTQKYWKVDWSAETEMTTAQAAQDIAHLLPDAVRLRLQSDVPLGAILSGDVDSSLIVAIAHQQLEHPLKTFGIAFRDQNQRETRSTRQVAHWVGTEHNEHRVAFDLAELLELLVTHYDEPFADSEALRTWCLCQWVSKHVKVALSGCGGNELFAGYDRYRSLWLSNWLSRAFPVKTVLGASWIQRLPSSRHQTSFVRSLQRLGAGLHTHPARRTIQGLQVFPESLRISLYRDDFIQQLPDEDPFLFFESAWKKMGQRGLVTQASLTDILTYLPCDLLNRIDVASMAHSMECRHPMLDYRLVELSARMPSHLKMGLFQNKRILRTAFDSLLPRQIWTRKSVDGLFPSASWFRNELKPLVQQRLSGNDVRCHQFFQPEIIDQMISQHATGRSNHAEGLWCLLVLETWLRRWN